MGGWLGENLSTEEAEANSLEVRGGLSYGQGVILAMGRDFKSLVAAFNLHPGMLFDAIFCDLSPARRLPKPVRFLTGLS